ncbi:hypothetical protein E2C01_057207 [Portunus trituberculatus]|uniref:Uncharacterized protein n=1 Tax=Portunus trituberculatus TaxID=210409 RepID=A0A5B7GW63_PORTR|nr:hypothetical protein [Portunus trituberculatus]
MKALHSVLNTDQCCVVARRGKASVVPATGGGGTPALPLSASGSGLMVNIVGVRTLVPPAVGGPPLTEAKMTARAILQCRPNSHPFPVSAPCV